MSTISSKLAPSCACSETSGPSQIENDRFVTSPEDTDTWIRQAIFYKDDDKCVALYRFGFMHIRAHACHVYNGDGLLLDERKLADVILLNHLPFGFRISLQANDGLACVKSAHLTIGVTPFDENIRMQVQEVETKCQRLVPLRCVLIDDFFITKLLEMKNCAKRVPLVDIIRGNIVPMGRGMLPRSNIRLTDGGEMLVGWEEISPSKGVHH